MVDSGEGVGAKLREEEQQKVVEASVDRRRRYSKLVVAAKFL